MERVLQVMGGMNRRGAEAFIMNVYRKIDRTQLQFDFLVYTDAKQDFEDEIISLGGRVIHMPCSTGIGVVRRISMIRDVIRKYGPYKAIHAQTLLNSCYPLLAAKAFPNIIRITHSHNTQNRVNPNLFVRIYEWISKKIIQKYTQIMFACGEPAGKYLFGEKFNETGIVLKNGIDLDAHVLKDESAIINIKKELHLENALVIGSVARFNEVKNHTFMLRIAKVLNNKGVNFKMVFVGDGNLLDSIKQEATEIDVNDNIVFAGLRSDIPDLMHAFDVFLMPSIFEGNPVTLVEAQAAGISCVITDNISDEMDMGLGLINKCSLDDSAEDWGNAIIRASSYRICDTNLICEQMVRNGYDSQTTAELLQNIYIS